MLYVDTYSQKLLCTREDIVLLAKDVNLLVNSKNPDICHDDFWYTLFRNHLKNRIKW